MPGQCSLNARRNAFPVPPTLMQKHDESSVIPSEYQYSRKQVEGSGCAFLGQYEAHLQKWGVFGLPLRK
jgi:hypothetical protein